MAASIVVTARAERSVREVVTETERLYLRKLDSGDEERLYEIMGKERVMYAWEHGFSREDVREWVERQMGRYERDGMAYWGVIEKDSGRLVGQAGLLRSEVNGEMVVEIGYIFDDEYWHRGFAYEAVQGCMRYAFEVLGIDAVYATIRPMNKASVRLAERLGMRVCGECVKVYRGKEMKHETYLKFKV